MMRRARISVRPNVRPVGRGPSSSQDGQSMHASTVNSLAAGETSQTIEMVSNVTDNEPAPEESVIKFPEASGFTSTHDTLSEKALCNLGENGQTGEASGDCIPAETSLKRRESVSGVCNIAQPRVIPKHLSTKALQSSVSKAVTMASCSVAPVSVPEDKTVTENEGLKSPGPQKLPVRGKRPRKADNLGLAFTGVCVPSPKDLAVSMRKESEFQPSTSAVVHETSSMSSYQERIIKSRMLKQLMKEELKKKRKKYKPHLEYINPLDHSKMTMRDLIYYLPDSSPMKSYITDGQAGKENPRLLSNETIEMPQKEAEEEEDDCDEDLSQNDDELVVPKVKVAEDGSLILDEDSLTVKVSRATGPTIVEENDPLFERGSTTTYSSFRKIRHVKPWSIKETDMFFLAISMVGTDFSIIGQLLPHRPRKEIKNKFRKEERINAWRIDKAFREKRPYDPQFFSMLLGRILAAEKKKRNVNMRDSKAKKVNTQESKPKKKKKTKMEVRETAQQDESHVTIEEEESDCRVTEGNMEMTEKENEDSINFLKVGNKTLPNKKTGERRNTEKVADTSSAKPVGGKKRKTKTSVEIINCDEVGAAHTSSEETESTTEHTAPGDRSNGATATLSPSSRQRCQNPTANIGKRVRKRIPGSPENRGTCSAEDESRVNSVCVSTVENEAAILNREEFKKAGQIITLEEDFVEEPENMDWQLNRSGCLSHEDLVNSSPSIQHRPREACSLTSITAEESCQEKEYGATSSPDGVKMDTVHDESAIKYVQDDPTENSEKDSSGQTQDEMSRGTDIMDLSLERRNQIPSLAQVAQIQQSCVIQSSDVSPAITNAADKVSLPTVFEGRDDLENSFTNNQKEKQFDNQNLEHEEARSGCLSHEDLFSSSSSVQHRPREACSLTSITAKKSCQEKEYGATSSPDGVKMDTVHDESAIKYVQDDPTENSEKDSSGQTQDEMSRGTDIMDLSLERRNQIPSLAQVAQIQQSCVIQSSDVSPAITNAADKVSLPTVFEGRDDLKNSFTNNQKEKQFDNQNLEHEEARTRDSSDGKTSPKKSQTGSLGRRRCRQPKPNLSRVSRGLSVISAKSKEGMKEVKDATEEHLHDLNVVRCVENRSGCLSHEDLFNSSCSIQHRPREACSLTSITAEESCQEKEYSATSSPDGVKMDTVHDESAIKYVQDDPTENSEKDSSGQTQDEMSSTRDNSDGKRSPKKAQSDPLDRRRCQQPNLSRVSMGLSVISVQRNEGMKEVKDAVEEHHEDLKALRSVENRAYHPLRSSSIREKIPEAVMEMDMQPVQAISSTVTAEVVTRLPPKGDSCGIITTVAMVTEAVTTDVTEQEPTFILTLVPVSEAPPPPESTEQQSELLLPACQSLSSVQESEADIESGNFVGLLLNYVTPIERYSTQYSTLERDFVSDQVLNTSSSSTQKDTKDPEDHFGAKLHIPLDTYLEGAASKKAPSIKCKKSFAATKKRAAKQNSKRNLPEATKKDQATLKEPEQLDVLPSSSRTVQPISVRSTTEEAVTHSAKVEMSQDTVYLLDLSIKNKNKEIAEDQSSPTFRSEEEVLKSNPLVTPLFLKALKLQKNDDDTKTERKMPLDPPIASHSSASDISATYSPSSPTKVYCNISQPAQCEFLRTSVKEMDEGPTNVSEYFFSDIFTEVKESESD